MDYIHPFTFSLLLFINEAVLVFTFAYLLLKFLLKATAALFGIKNL
jgi:hypothetical protein